MEEPEQRSVTLQRLKEQVNSIRDELGQKEHEIARKLGGVPEDRSAPRSSGSAPPATAPKPFSSSASLPNTTPWTLYRGQPPSPSSIPTLSPTSLRKPSGAPPPTPEGQHLDRPTAMKSFRPPFHPEALQQGGLMVLPPSPGAVSAVPASLGTEAMRGAVLARPQPRDEVERLREENRRLAEEKEEMAQLLRAAVSDGQRSERLEGTPRSTPRSSTAPTPPPPPPPPASQTDPPDGQGEKMFTGVLFTAHHPDIAPKRNSGEFKHPFDPTTVLSRPIDEVLSLCPAFRKNFEDCDAARRLELRTAWQLQAGWLTPLLTECWQQGNFIPLNLPPVSPTHSKPPLHPSRPPSPKVSTLLQHIPQPEGRGWGHDLPLHTKHPAEVPQGGAPHIPPTEIEQHIAAVIANRKGTHFPTAHPPVDLKPLMDTIAALTTQQHHTPTFHAFPPHQQQQPVLSHTPPNTAEHETPDSVETRKVSPSRPDPPKPVYQDPEVYLRPVLAKIEALEQQGLEKEMELSAMRDFLLAIKHKTEEDAHRAEQKFQLLQEAKELAEHRVAQAMAKVGQLEDTNEHLQTTLQISSMNVAEELRRANERMSMCLESESRLKRQLGEKEDQLLDLSQQHTLARKSLDEQSTQLEELRRELHHQDTLLKLRENELKEKDRMLSTQSLELLALRNKLQDCTNYTKQQADYDYHHYHHQQQQQHQHQHQQQPAGSLPSYSMRYTSPPRLHNPNPFSTASSKESFPQLSMSSQATPRTSPRRSASGTVQFTDRPTTTSYPSSTTTSNYGMRLQELVRRNTALSPIRQQTASRWGDPLKP